MRGLQPTLVCATRGRAFPLGLTLLELLASLALLAMIAAACLAVLRSATQTAIAQTADARWHAAASALLDSIAADLIAADLDAVADHARNDPRIVVSGADNARSLTIRTRCPALGPCTRVYTLHHDALHVLTTQAPAALPAASRSNPGAVSSILPAGSPAGPPALAQLGRFDATLTTAPSNPALLISLHSSTGQSIARLFLLDPEPAP